MQISHANSKHTSLGDSSSSFSLYVILVCMWVRCSWVSGQWLLTSIAFHLVFKTISLRESTVHYFGWLPVSNQPQIKLQSMLLSPAFPWEMAIWTQGLMPKQPHWVTFPVSLYLHLKATNVITVGTLHELYNPCAFQRSHLQTWVTVKSKVKILTKGFLEDTANL